MDRTQPQSVLLALSLIKQDVSYRLLHAEPLNIKQRLDQFRESFSVVGLCVFRKNVEIQCVNLRLLAANKITSSTLAPQIVNTDCPKRPPVAPPTDRR